MGRFNRVVAIDKPHHVTQRGNGRRFVLEADADRTVYLKLLRENSASMASPSSDIASSQPYPLDRGSSQSRRTSTCPEADPRALRFLLERDSPIERADVAGKILLLPPGPDASLGGLALHRTQSGESRFGLGGRVVALVQRSLSLRR